MKVEYKKDLRANYMVITKEEVNESEPFSIKMLSHQAIRGILPLEQRRIDNRLLFYYDITSKQSMAAILDKTALTKERLTTICIGIIANLERAYEYLLPEDDFILRPEYIYLGVASDEPILCFLPGFQKDCKEQMSSLFEFLMNKVNYNDREAVLLIYRLYAVSKEEGYTFEHLLKELGQDQFQIASEMNESQKRSDQKISEQDNKSKENKHTINEKEKVQKRILTGITEIPSHIPIMMEKLEQEEEVSCYPILTYLYTGLCIVAGILLIILCIRFKILYNLYGNRIDFVKLSALLLIVFCMEGYVLKLIWDKKNKITKMVTKNEYIDPRQLMKTSSAKTRNSLTEKEAATDIYQDEDYNRQQRQDILGDCMIPEYNMANRNREGKVQSGYEEDNPTCLLSSICEEESGLNPAMTQISYHLKALNDKNYQNISITSFPFFIGKLKKNVDYCLEKEVVSRYHAKITMEEEKLYITDLNSTNGTFVNGQALQTYETLAIHDGDEIAFADIKYRMEICTME